MLLRYCLPRVKNRGYGLGNELIPWARAFLAAQVLNATLLPPAFGMNRRGYWWYFRSAPDDWIHNRAIEYLLPVVEFGEADYVAHGAGDVVVALQGFAAAHRLFERRAYALVTSGLWGGYRHIEAAREFIRSTLYQSRHAARNLLRLRSRIEPGKLLVGMHVRLGDFVAAGAAADYRRVANMSLPIEWFCRVAQCLRRTLGEGWQLLLVSDGTQEQLQPLTSAWPCIITADLPMGDCSDALALAGADLLVCSASTYSTLAAFLSDSPYLWYAPNLYQHPEGAYSTGDYTQQRERPGHPTRSALEYFLSAQPQALPRGVAVQEDGEVPAAVIDAAIARFEARRWQTDLARAGVARAVGAGSARQSLRA